MFCRFLFDDAKLHILLVLCNTYYYNFNKYYVILFNQVTKKPPAKQKAVIRRLSMSIM